MGKCHISLNKNSFAYMTPRPLSIRKISLFHTSQTAKGPRSPPPPPIGTPHPNSYVQTWTMERLCLEFQVQHYHDDEC